MVLSMKKNKWTFPFGWNDENAVWKKSATVRVLLYLVLGLVFYFSLSGHLFSKTYDFEVGDRAGRDILAPRQIYDEKATERARQEAIERVEDVYTVLPVRNLEIIEHIFAKLLQLNADDQVSDSDKVEVYRLFFAQEYQELLRRPISGNRELSETLLNEVIEQLTDQQYRIPEETYFKLPRLNREQIENMRTVARDIVGRLTSDRIIDASVPRGRVAEMLLASNLNDKTERELVQEIIRFALTPNTFFDQELTEEAKKRAEEAVEPVYIEKNEVIVRAGQIITPELYELLEANDLLRDHIHYWPILGMIIMVGLFLFVLHVFVRRSEREIRTDNSKLLMLILILVLNVLAMKVIASVQSMDYPFIGYLAPVALGTMLITILLETRLAFISLVLFSIMASIMFNIEHADILFDYRYGFVTAVVCFVSIFAIHQAGQRSAILRAGMLVSLFACLSIAALVLLENEFVMMDIALSLGFAFASGLLTAVLVIGLLPFFEVAFGILSPLKLVELSNPNHPLLRKLLTEAPGSYHHSVMVANLAETAAEAIGANGLLCRVGSFYHDIGKTKRPSYFIENQGNMENPHDRIDPALSKEIIIAHARDGAEMLREYKMPKQLCDIAEQHHGTTLLKYFYHKALKQQEENPENTEPVREEDYRYPGPKAQTKEAAIVGIADCVEAAVRSLSNPTVEQIDTMVDKIIKSRLDDNQFNECDLTLKELEKIAQALKETLLGIFHSRIEYPDLPAKDKSGGTAETAAASSDSGASETRTDENE